MCALLVSLFTGLLFVSPAAAQPSNNPPRPTAESVDEQALFRQSPRIEGRVSIQDPKAAVLEQPQGRDWRRFHESWMPWIGGVAVLGMLLVLVVFYLWRGTIRLDGKDKSGATITRFNGFERFVHWLVATCFIILGLSGLNYIYGKRLLMPLIGPQAFGDFSQWAKFAHNFLAWPFTIGILFMLVIWVRDNVPRRVDWAWLKAGGGMFGGSSHPSAGRFNAGQKIMFWGVIVGGLAMFATGLILLFPFSVAGVRGMQIASSAHSLIGVIFVAAILAHIYIGSIGMEGSFQAMGSGEVDLAWARRHHDQWAREEEGRLRANSPPPASGSASGVAPARAPERSGP
jgi:formate dehydrogenase subunit gamma